MIETNFLSVVVLTRELAVGMRARNRGHIVSICRASKRPVRTVLLHEPPRRALAVIDNPFCRHCLLTFPVCIRAG